MGGEILLTQLHDNLPVELVIDASSTRFGAELSHVMLERNERPKASRSLNKAGKCYTQLHNETTALI